MLGTGLMGTVVPLKMKSAHYSDFVIGAIGSVYYLGMFGGSISVIKFLDKIGPSKTFIITTCALSLVTIAPGFEMHLLLWFIARFISGYNLAWLYIIVESWVLNVSNSRNRGRNLAIYMIVLYLGQSVGQLFLKFTDIKTLTPFLVSSILVFTSIIPLLFSKSSISAIAIPQTLGFRNIFKISSTGIIGCMISGVILAAIYSLLPVYFRDYGYDPKNIATMMSFVIAGGVALQYPLGVLSDKVDRRLTLMGMCCAGMLVCLLMLCLGHFTITSALLVYAAIFLFGGITFSIYPVSLNHTCDHVDNTYIVEVTQGMMLAYGFGSAIGPITISTVMNFLGPNGIFYSFIFVLFFFNVYMLIRTCINSKYEVSNEFGECK